MRVEACYERSAIRQDGREGKEEERNEETHDTRGAGSFAGRASFGRGFSRGILSFFGETGGLHLREGESKRSAMGREKRERTRREGVFTNEMMLLTVEAIVELTPIRGAVACRFDVEGRAAEEEGAGERLGGFRTRGSAKVREDSKDLSRENERRKVSPSVRVERGQTARESRRYGIVTTDEKQTEIGQFERTRKVGAKEDERRWNESS